MIFGLFVLIKMLTILSDKNSGYDIFSPTCNYFLNKYSGEEVFDLSQVSPSSTVILTNSFSGLSLCDKYKVIYYLTNPIGNPIFQLNDVGLRRYLLLNLKKAFDVFMPSLYLSRKIYENFKVMGKLQYPYVNDLFISEPNYILYSKNIENIEFIKNLFPSENFKLKTNNEDFYQAKLYLYKIDNGICLDYDLILSSSHGIPIISEDNNFVKEFLGEGDVVISNASQWEQSIKISLRDRNSNSQKVKLKSTRYNKLNDIENKIQQILKEKIPHRINPKSFQDVQKIANNHESKTTNQSDQRKIMGSLRSNVQQSVYSEIEHDKPIFISGVAYGISGYDLFVLQIMKGLVDLNFPIYINSTCTLGEIVPQKVKRLIRQKQIDHKELIITAPPFLHTYNPNKNSIVYTMWETEHLEKEWTQTLNRASRLIVPTEWNKQVFHRFGVTVPIDVISLGYDPIVYFPRYTPPDICTFGTAGSLTSGGVRKNVKYLVDTFLETFINIPNVKLKIKLGPGSNLNHYNDHRIEVTHNHVDNNQLNLWYNSLTAFVNTSHCEGFGLHLLEAMACGIPLVTTNYSGITAYFNPDNGYDVQYDRIAAHAELYRGEWSQPNKESLMLQLRSVYDNLEMAKEKGERSALWTKNLTWKKMGQKLANIIEQELM